MPYSLSRATSAVGVLVVVAISATSTGCAQPELDEPEGSTSSELRSCEVLASAAGATAAVAVSSAGATGTCAAGAAAATVMTAGVAAPGTVVCLAPALSTAVSSVAALLAAGAAYLICGEVESRVTLASIAANGDDDTRATPAPTTRVDRTQCEDLNPGGLDNPGNRSATSSSQCPPDGQRHERLDRVLCTVPVVPSQIDYRDPSGRGWNCAGRSPHHPCIPTLANGGDATHRHVYRGRYNFSPNKACCFYQDVEIEVRCGAY